MHMVKKTYRDNFLVPGDVVRIGQIGKIVYYDPHCDDEFCCTFVESIPTYCAYSLP